MTNKRATLAKRLAAPRVGFRSLLGPAKFAGALAVGIVGVSLVSAEVIRQAVGKQLAIGAQASSASSAGPALREGAPIVGETRVASLADTAVASDPSAPQVRPPGAAALPDNGPLVALVIGNAAYPDVDAPLSQPLNDARALADELRRRGFDVETGENLTRQGMERAIERFAAKIKPGATALLFYSGLGVQAGRESFLIPVNAQIWRPEDVRRDGIALEPLVSELNARGAKRRLVILDASRRNPYERRLRGFSAGLAPIAASEGALVLYGVAPGKVAADSAGANSLLVGELLNQLRATGESGGSAEAAFNRTRVAVARASNGEQVPGVFSALVDDFAFPAPAPSPAATSPADASPGLARKGRR